MGVAAGIDGFAVHNEVRFDGLKPGPGVGEPGDEFELGDVVFGEPGEFFGFFVCFVVGRCVEVGDDGGVGPQAAFHVDAFEVAVTVAGNAVSEGVEVAGEAFDVVHAGGGSVPAGAGRVDGNVGFFVDFPKGSGYWSFVGVDGAARETPRAAGVGPLCAVLHENEGGAVFSGGTEEKSGCAENPPAMLVLGANAHSIAIMIHDAYFTGERGGSGLFVGSVRCWLQFYPENGGKLPATPTGARVWGPLISCDERGGVSALTPSRTTYIRVG